MELSEFSQWDQADIFCALLVAALILLFLALLAGSFGRGEEGGGGRREAREPRYNSLLSMYQVRHVNAIVDQFKSLDEVSKAIRRAGLESSNLIFGVDYTASNNYQGEKTFGGKCLHLVQPGLDNPYQQGGLFQDLGPLIALCHKRGVQRLLVRNSGGIDYTISNLHQGERTFQGKSLHAVLPGIENPYQKVIKIMGETLEPFDDDGIIPAFGFGDNSTRDRSVFSLRAEGYCRGFHDVLQAYNQISQSVSLSGPTNFAPLIYQAIDIVKQTRAYHILVIVADGQVTSERSTRDAIVEASKWALSIIVVGVGDGPWDMMVEFDDSLPERKFDNFQFVDFNRVLTFGTNPDATFAVHALMEIPDQFKQIRQLGLLDF